MLFCLIRCTGIFKVSIGDEFKFDHDLCLLVEYEEPFKPQVVLEDGNPEAGGSLLRSDMQRFLGVELLCFIQWFMLGITFLKVSIVSN